MKLIVGLGNPGKQYENTRHNVGFMVVDHFVKSGDWQKKFDGLLQILTIQGEKALFLKPTTFMNLSGNSIIKAVKYYDIDIQDILIIQDDMDLSFRTFKLKKDSSAGGHNGIKSIISALNSKNFARLKVGISHDEKGNTIDYVLGKFSKQELQYFQDTYETFNAIITSFITDGIEKTMNKYN